MESAANGKRDGSPCAAFGVLVAQARSAGKGGRGGIRHK